MFYLKKIFGKIIVFNIGKKEHIYETEPRHFGSGFLNQNYKKAKSIVRFSSCL